LKQALAVVLSILVAGLVAISLHLLGVIQRVPLWIVDSSFVGTLRQIDSGALKVAWANYQVSTFFLLSFFVLVFIFEVGTYKISSSCICSSDRAKCFVELGCELP
jgi:Na+/pantothenate symporter